MATTATNPVDWKVIWAQRGFRYFFLAMFVSLFGSGMNFAGVSWYILSATHSTVKVSLQVIVVTLPGLFVPFLGGVLIDRLDRRYLGVLLDIVRGFFVLATAYIAWRGHLQLWHLYAMTLITGVGSAMYWATVNALVQEVIPPSQFTGANAAVLVGVQSGMLMAGAFVGFLYNSAGIAGILAIDGATYFVSAYCLYQVRRGYVSPRESQKYPREYSEATEATAEALETGENPEVAEAGLSLAVYADMKEGFAYLKQQPLVLALGITHAIMLTWFSLRWRTTFFGPVRRGWAFWKQAGRSARLSEDSSPASCHRRCACPCMWRLVPDSQRATWRLRSSRFLWAQ